LGGALNVAIRLTPNQKLVFRNTLTHDTEKSSREFSGYDGSVDSFVESQRLRWIERSLFSTSVEGDHSMPNLRATDDGLYGGTDPNLSPPRSSRVVQQYGCDEFL
jgi:hypothetical protein